jgi:hypothetical protein
MSHARGVAAVGQDDRAGSVREVDQAGSATAARADSSAASDEMAHIATMVHEVAEGDDMGGREVDCFAASNPNLQGGPAQETAVMDACRGVTNRSGKIKLARSIQ